MQNLPHVAQNGCVVALGTNENTIYLYLYIYNKIYGPNSFCKSTKFGQIEVKIGNVIVLEKLAPRTR